MNFPGFQASAIALASGGNNVKYEELDPSQIQEFDRYDAVLIFGMGVKWNAEERAKVQELTEAGVPIQVLYPTTPENNLVGIEAEHAKRITEYLDNGNKHNYTHLGHYIRKYVDGKRFFTSEPEDPIATQTDVFYHIDESIAIADKHEFEAYLKRVGYWHEGGERVVVLGGLNDPFSGNKANVDSLITSLHRIGVNVYPVASMTKRIQFLDAVQPDLVLYFPHGRLNMMGQADQTVEYLRKRNIPLLTPLTLLTSQKDWEADPMGLVGGFMGQTITMPELDGAIYPYVINTQERNSEGYDIIRAIPERLATFTKLVKGYLTLRKKGNADKKLAIYFFKAPGAEAMVAQGLETVPSLYSLLLRLKSEGYDLTGLPNSLEEFRRDIMRQGKVLAPYAEGSASAFIKEGKPFLLEAERLKQWLGSSISAELITQLEETYGPIPGQYMSYTDADGKAYLAISRLQYGNVAILPQPAAGMGGDSFAVAHGAGMAPPYLYVGAYLWAKHEWQADAILHFGTHGSLEFTPSKQVALSRLDWADQLIAGTPHFYYYTIGNVGESMMAKRRSYAMLVSYLTPPFRESGARKQFSALQSAIETYYNTSSSTDKASRAQEIKRIATQMGIHRDLGLSDNPSVAYTEDEIQLIDNFAEEIASEKINGQLYVTGTPYSHDYLRSTVQAMTTDPIAYSMAKVDALRGRAPADITTHKRAFEKKYLSPARALVGRVLAGSDVNEALILQYAQLSKSELDSARVIAKPAKTMEQLIMEMMADTTKQSKGAGAGMASMSSSSTHNKPRPKSGGGHPAWIPKIGTRPKHVGAGQQAKTSDAINARNQAATQNASAQAHPAGMGGAQKPKYSKEQVEWAEAIIELERTIHNIVAYKVALEQSPTWELNAIVNALSGGYTAPSSGGDAVANPSAVPTGKNLYSINAETTPSQRAWSKAVTLVNSTLKDYKSKHGKYPEKVSYTFWSSEFIESEGATIAQALYMLGVEPVRDMFGRVSDLRLIPISELGRPRIDIVIQTSGQFRDLAASRLSLLNRAVQMASQAGKEDGQNLVHQGTIRTEELLVEAGLSPKEARELATSRIFGGVNGMYGTGIQEMITSGDKWEHEAEIAEVYLNNMGALYEESESWGKFVRPLFRAALANTDIVIQPRQSNTWGALSLDHVYEFMGGLTLTVRNVTGKDPETYFADYRNRNNARIQDLKQAVGVESRSTILNPSYIKEMLEGGASSLGRLTEIVTNTYGWEVSKPELINDQLWQDLYNIYVQDSLKLGIRERFEQVHPTALQEVSAVMLETIRKGMWTPSTEVVRDIAQLHAELTAKHGAATDGMSARNTKLQSFIAQQASPEVSKSYQQAVQSMRSASSTPANDKASIVMKKDESSPSTPTTNTSLRGLWIALGVLGVFVTLLILLRRRRKQA